MIYHTDKWSESQCSMNMSGSVMLLCAPVVEQLGIYEHKMTVEIALLNDHKFH